MQISTETVGRLLASGRNAASTLVGFIGGVGVISAAQSKGLTDALTEIFNGLSMVLHGATSMWQILIVAFPAIGGLMAYFANRSAKTENQAIALHAAVVDPNTPITPETKSVIVSTAKEAAKV